MEWIGKTGLEPQVKYSFRYSFKYCKLGMWPSVSQPLCASVASPVKWYNTYFFKGLLWDLNVMLVTFLPYYLFNFMACSFIDMQRSVKSVLKIRNISHTSKFTLLTHCVPFIYKFSKWISTFYIKYINDNFIDLHKFQQWGWFNLLI